MLPSPGVDMIKLMQPDNAPNFCFEIANQADGRSVFIQSDWDYPGVARSFGWPGEDSQIGEAFQFLCDNVGATAEDPGYFN
jgi:hypothetical protein